MKIVDGQVGENEQLDQRHGLL
ncbi:hypothetical protein CP082626L3_0350A, partial [Chlamydia psittaci 08-2626_L3]